jgi:adenosine kinase
MSFPGYFRENILPEHLDKISVSFLVDDMVRQRGGTAPNIAYSLALLGECPILMGTVGQDFADYDAWLKSKGVDTSCVKVIPDKYTASFFANTDRSNAQICSFYTGAMLHARELSILDVQPAPRLVIISPNDPVAMDKYVMECRENDIPYLYDPGQQVVRSDPAELRRGVEGAHSLFVNEYEFELLQKHTHMDQEEILNLVDVLVVTLGEKGAAIYADGKRYVAPAVTPRQILDPTGVGDAFRAGFVSGEMHGLSWDICGQMGAMAATYCLETRGPQEHSYNPAEFVARFRQNFDDHGVLNVLLS